MLWVWMVSQNPSEEKGGKGKLKSKKKDFVFELCNPQHIIISCFINVSEKFIIPPFPSVDAKHL